MSSRWCRVGPDRPDRVRACRGRDRDRGAGVPAGRCRHPGRDRVPEGGGPGGGTVTVSETVAAGTDLAATTHAVSGLVPGAGVPSTSTDVVGNTTVTEYDRAGRPVQVTDPAGNTTTTEYLTVQQDGVNATMVTGPDGVVTHRDPGRAGSGHQGDRQPEGRHPHGRARAHGGGAGVPGPGHGDRDGRVGCDHHYPAGPVRSAGGDDRTERADRGERV